jgi:hypothetical protein
VFSAFSETKNSYRTAACIKDKAVGEVLLVDLLLFLLNQPAAGAARFAYVRAFGLAAPLDDVDVLLEHVGRRLGLLAAGNRVNEEQVGVLACVCASACACARGQNAWTNQISVGKHGASVLVIHFAFI